MVSKAGPRLSRSGVVDVDQPSHETVRCSCRPAAMHRPPRCACSCWAVGLLGLVDLHSLQSGGHGNVIFLTACDHHMSRQRC
jgi:hypothetical protein